MKYKLFLKVLSVLLISIYSIHVNAQDNDNLQLQDVTENISISTDRDLYFSGENIYFNANYFINKQVSKNIKLSNVAYAELISCYDNKAIIQKKYRILDGKLSGNVEIPSDIATGLYIFRVYTQYQRNFSSYNYAYNFISVINPDNVSQPVDYISETDQIVIAPEGNILIENMVNDIVIHIPKHILNETNMLSIIDKQNNTIVNLDSLTSEFIKLTDFNPLESNGYNLQLLKNNGDSIVKQMPKVQKTGIQTNVQLSANNLMYNIESNEIYKNSPKYKLAVYSSDFKSNYRNDITITDSKVVEIIPTNKLSYGINYLVLSDVNGKIQKINSYFKSNIIKNIDINLSKESYNQRDEILAEITTKINQNNLSNASISVSKTGSNKEDYNFNSSIYLKNPLLLQNYLESNVDYSTEDLKQMMILFDSKLDNNIINEGIISLENNSLKHIPEIRDLTISGILVNKETKEPVSNHDIYLSVLFNNPQIHIYKTRENGEFIFSLNNLYGENDIYLCAEQDGENEYEILIKSSFSNNIPQIGPTPLFINEQYKDLIEDIYINAQVEQRVPKNAAMSNESSTNVNVFNINEDNKATTILANFVQLKNVEELFFELVPNAKINDNNDQYSFTVLNKKGFALAGKPLVILDHIPIFDPTKIIGLDINKIEKVEVIYKTYFLGANTFHGIIMISTKKDDFGNIKFAQSGTFLKYETLVESENNVVLSNNSRNLSEKSPNFKTSLYWNSEFKLSNEKNSIRFFSTDNKGVYNIVVKAYSPDGQIYYGKKQFNIN